MGAAGRPRPALPALRPAVRGHRTVGRGDLGPVRALVGGRRRGRGAVGGVRGPLRPPSFAGRGRAAAGRSATRLWTTLPGLPGFAGGFVLWGLGGALASGTQEALLHDGLDVAGAADQYARVQGWVGAAGLAAQVPAAGAATALFAAGGYLLVGWVSVATCVGTAVLAARLPESRDARRRMRPTRGAADAPGRTWRRCGTAWRRRPPAGRCAARCSRSGCSTGWTRSRSTSRWSPAISGSSTVLVPSALLAIPLVGARRRGAGRPGEPAGAGSALAGLLLRVPDLLAVVAEVPQPAALAGVALFYGLYRMVLVVADARLQERIAGPARATVTSVANVVAELPRSPCTRRRAGRHGRGDGAGGGRGAAAAGAAAAALTGGRAAGSQPRPQWRNARRLTRVARLAPGEAAGARETAGLPTRGRPPPPSTAAPAAIRGGSGGPGIRDDRRAERLERQRRARGRWSAGPASRTSGGPTAASSRRRAPPPVAASASPTTGRAGGR